jgi:flagellar hook-length control protein FliK
VPGMAAKAGPGADTIGAVSTFSTILQISLKDSASELGHTGLVPSTEVKSRTKSAPTESPKSGAPPTSGDMLSANPTIAAALNYPVATIENPPVLTVPEFAAPVSSNDSSAIGTASAEDAAPPTGESSTSFSSGWGVPTSSSNTWRGAFCASASQTSFPTLSSAAPASSPSATVSADAVGTNGALATSAAATVSATTAPAVPEGSQTTTLPGAVVSMSVSGFPIHSAAPADTKSGSSDSPEAVLAATPANSAATTVQGEIQTSTLPNFPEPERRSANAWRKIAAIDQSAPTATGAHTTNQSSLAAFAKNESHVPSQPSQPSQPAIDSNASRSSTPTMTGGSASSENSDAAALQAKQTTAADIFLDPTAHKAAFAARTVQADKDANNSSSQAANSASNSPSSNASNSDLTTQGPNSTLDNSSIAAWNPPTIAHANDVPASLATIPALPTAAAMSGSDSYKVSTTLGSPTPSNGASADGLVRQLADEEPTLSAGLQAWNGGENLQGDVTQAAHLGTKASQSEMNIAMQVEALGAVQVHTHVTGDQVGAAITVERHEAHAFLTSDLPALHQALNDRQLRPENISVSQGSFPSGGGISDGAARQHSQGGSPQRSFYSGGTPPAPFSGALDGSTFADATDTRAAFDSNGRLSVRA